MAHARTGCVRRFTTTRDNSSQAPEALESTPFIGDDDATFLQRMVALGSSASQASDLAPLSEQLATPNVPIMMKTIGAKVIVAALEQRQQWALLPALLSFPEFRRLAEIQKFGVGEQLFAALLRGQFAFASRRRGATPDVFRTLDLAAKCNAIHTPEVDFAVRAGYHALGLDSPTRITELLDVGSISSASLERLAQRQKDNEEDEDKAFEPVGRAIGRLTLGKFIGQIVWARRTQSMHAVLPAVLAALPQIYNANLKDRPKILGALCGRDIYSVSEVQGLARALGTLPDAILWSQVTVNAVRMSGPTEAAAIVQHVYDNVSDGYIAYNAVHQVIVTLVGRDYQSAPSCEDVQLAWKLFELHRIKGGDRALYLRPDSPGSLMPLILALMADINIPGRELAVEVLCRYTEEKKILQGGGNFRVTWAGTVAQLAASRFTSHMDALDAALVELAGQTTEHDLQMVFSFITRFRYAAATTAPIAVLLRATALARSKGFSLNKLVSTYIDGIHRSLLRLHIEMGVGLLPVNSLEDLGETVPQQHTSQALASLRHVERLCHEPNSGFTLDASIALALFSAYSVHSGAPDDCARLRPMALAHATVVDPNASRPAGFRLFEHAKTYKEVKEIWAALSSQGLPQDVVVLCSYASKLLAMHRVHAAIEFARRQIPDDPNNADVVRFVARLLLWTEDTRFRLTARDAFPITVNDGRTREALNKVITFRKGLGLTRQTTASDI